MTLRPWKTEKDLMERLETAQNHSALQNQDVMTWAGMCDDRAELERHVANCERRVAEFVPSRKRRG